jgi:hypothetical protein
MAEYNELYVYDLTGDRYVHIPTYGTKPPVFSNFEVHEALQLIVAWCGKDGAEGRTVRSTSYLDLATLHWRAGPSAANGDTVPPITAPTDGTNLMYDDLNKCMILACKDPYGLQVWRLDIAGPAT